MNAEELKDCVRAALTSAMPKYAIQIEELDGQAGDLGVAVFDVEPEMVKWVRETILDLDAELCIATEFALTPLVRDVETTRKFYPQFMTPWTIEVDRGQSAQCESIPAAAPDSLLVIADGAWTPSVAVEVCAMAANEDLALAA